MKGTTLSGTVWCWRGTGEDELPVNVHVRLHVVPVPPDEGRGYEVDVLEATADGRAFALTDAEVERAVEVLGESHE